MTDWQPVATELASVLRQIGAGLSLLGTLAVIVFVVFMAASIARCVGYGA